MIDAHGSVWSEKLLERHIRHLTTWFKLNRMDAWRFLVRAYGLSRIEA